MTTVAERGLPPRSPSGHALNAFGFAGSLRSLGDSPGCNGVVTVAFAHVGSCRRGDERKDTCDALQDRDDLIAGCNETVTNSQ